MRLFLKTFCLFLPVFFATSLSAIAADKLFTVNNVKVDITAESSVKAQQQAFEEARVKAFNILSARMLSEDEIEDFENPDSDIISSLIQDFEIQNEKLSSVRYIASYNFRFKDEEVRRYLSFSGLEYTDVSSKPSLVLPFYQHQGQIALWSPNNIWMQAWGRAVDLEGLVTLIVPLGDITDVQDVSGSDPLQYNQAGLSRILNRYGASEAITMIAVPDQYMSMVQSVDEPASGRLNVHIYRTDRGFAEFVQTLGISANQNETLLGLMDRAVKDVNRFLRRDWKSKTLASSGSEQSIEVRIPIVSLRQWTATQNKLRRVNGVSNVKIKSLKPGEAKVELFFNGDVQRLRLALQQGDMFLSGGVNNAINGQGNVYGYQPKYQDNAVYELTLNNQGFDPNAIIPQAGEETAPVQTRDNYYKQHNLSGTPSAQAQESNDNQPQMRKPASRSVRLKTPNTGSTRYVNEF